MYNHRYKLIFLIVMLVALCSGILQGQAKVDLTSLNSEVANQPSSTSITWHTGTPATNSNKIANPSSVDAGSTYYMSYFDSNLNCYSPAAAVPTLENVCPSTTVSLNTLNSTSSNKPSGTSVTWHTSTPPTGANKVASPGSVTSGIYYMAFFDSNMNCYSAGAPTIVTSANACASCSTINSMTVQEICDAIDADPTGSFATADCDGDGETNKEECDNSTNPKNPCSGGDVSGVDLNDTSSDWYTADCDGDGVTNGKEVDPNGDGTAGPNGTDPTNDCDFNAADQNYANATAAFKAKDCDGDGVTNALEIDPDGNGVAGGTNGNGDGPTDPTEDCDFNLADQNYAIATAAFKAKDCDGDGVTNANEIDPDGNGVAGGTNGNGDGPTNPAANCNFNLADQNYANASNAFKSKDCDGDGVTNANEIDPDGNGVAGGTNGNGDGPTDPTEDCEFNLADQNYNSATAAFKAKDCDGDGVTNALEIDPDGNGVAGGTNGNGDGPTDPTEDCEFNLADQNYANATAAFKAKDCDGDGVTNAREIDPDGNGVAGGMNGNGDGPTDPTEDCEFNLVDQNYAIATAAFKAKDCDGDGVTNALEIDPDGNGVPGGTNGNGDGPTDPTEDCEFNPADQNYAIATAAFKTKDCDGDGVTNAREIDPDGNGVAGGTNGNGDGPTDPTEDCEFNLVDQNYASATTAFKAKDCDSDGLNNGEEITGVDDPATTLDPDGDTTDPTDPDTDGDGNPDGEDPNPNTPTTADDMDSGSPGIVGTTDILGNDDYLPNNDPDNEGVTSITDKGTGTAAGVIAFDPTDGTLDYTPTAAEAGMAVTVIYEVCNDESGTAVCEEATVTINVGDPDTDGDGDPDSTDPAPNDACSYTASEAQYDASTSAWKGDDCDGDGVTNMDEVDPNGDGDLGGTNGDGDGPTDPQEECSLNVADVSVAATSTGDCDGDGVTNADEINGTDGDPSTPGDNTDPTEPCDYNEADQVLADVTSAWKSGDCDSDGLNNGEETTGVDDPATTLDPDGDTTDPTDPDTDGDGNPDGEDPNPNTPTTADDMDSGSPGIVGTTDILGNDDYLPNNDPDNEGVTSITDKGTGTAAGVIAFDPTDGTLDYTPTAAEAGMAVTVIYEVCNDESGTAVCEEATVTINVGDPDTDGDGDPDSTDPAPNDACSYTASEAQYDASTSAWKGDDCDGDGVTNMDEVDPNGDGDLGGTNGDGDGPTDPQEECSLNVADVSVAATSTGDCDGDGVTNADEINGTDGDPSTPGDNTDPTKPCDYNEADQVLADVTSAWKSGDCDSDGLNNGEETTGVDDPATTLDPDGDTTDPTDPDTDGDGNPDGEDPNPNTPTTADDMDSGSPGIVGTTDILDNDDYLPNNDPDNEGVTSITDKGTGTAAGVIAFDPTDGTLDYTPTAAEAGMAVTVIYEVCNDESGTAVCEEATVTINVGDPDTDGDGDPDSTDPAPNDACSYTASEAQYDASTSAWKGDDCDGDGVTNMDEVDPNGDGDLGGTNGDGDGPTDPQEECSLNVADVSVAATSTGDCDGDGVTNADEINGTDGDPSTPGDNTDPTEPCDYNEADQVLADVTSAWKSGDCDSDGLNNGEETTGVDDPATTLDPDGDTTDPTDPDTDGDGNPDGEDPNPNTPTTADDMDSGSPGIVGTTDILDNDDYLPNNDPDNEGVTSITDKGTGTAAGVIAFDPTDGTLDYTPTAAEAGMAVTVIYEVCNDESGTAVCEEATVTINVGDPDTDGDGDPDSTDPAPNDACSYTASEAQYDASTSAWKGDDCDGDGVTNMDEVDPNGDGDLGGTNGDGDGPTDPQEECSLNVADVSVAATSTGDCDGDGVTNADEINGTDGDPSTPGDNTDPTEPCDYNEADQVLADVTSAWKSGDCDSDGLNNGEETTGVDDPATTLDPDGDTTDPTDPDTDGDGNPDGEDPNPNTPTTADDMDSGSPGIVGTTDILDNDDYLPNNDPDNEGVTSITDKGTGTAAGVIAFDPTDGTLDYTPTAAEAGTSVTVIYEVCNDESGTAVCEEATVTINVGDPDTDGDGDPDSTDPAPNDACSYTASEAQYDASTSAWKGDDCDGDGVTNMDEVDPNGDGDLGGTNGDGDGPTDPQEECSLNVADVSVAATSTGDCDGDGVTNADEINGTDGDPSTPGDNTDPTKPCDYNEADQDYASTTQAWKDADCDGDAVTNGKEVDPDGNGTDEGNGTDPIDECSYDPSDQVGTPTADLSNCAACGDGPKTEQAICDSIAVNPSLGALDCDDDGMTNKEECDGGTDPTNPCEGADISEVDLNNKTSDWYTADCDGDAVPNGKEVDPDGDGTAGPNATDPTDPCSHNPADQVGTPTADLSSCPECGDGPKTEQAICDSIAVNPYLGTLDCDGDGMTNKEECDGGTDPTNPCEGADVSEVDLSDKTSDWYNADCDGDAVPNGKEVDPDGDGTAGPDGTDPTDPCSHNPADRTGTPTADLSTCSPCGDASNTETLCEEVEANPFLGTLDCDGDGISNADECDDNTNPEDKCDPLRPVITTVSKLNPLTCSGTDGSIKICGLEKDTTYFVDFLKNSAPGVQMTLVADASGCVTMTGLTAGTYDNFELADSRGCMSDIFTTDQVLFDPSGATITLGATQNPSSCGANDGFIVLDGLSPGVQYTLNYSRDNAAQTPISFTANGGGTYNLSGLVAGSYELQVMNQNCPSNTLTKELVGPSGANISITGPVNPSACGNNNGSFVVSGLAPGTTYVLNYQKDGNSQTPITFTASGTSFKVNGLTKGDYSFINVANNGCTSNMGNVVLSDPTAPVISVIGFNHPSACGEGDGNITLSGLVTGRTYTIFTTKNGVVQAPISYTATGSSYTLNSLGTGDYDVYVADGECLSNTISKELKDPGAANIIVSSSDDPTSCGASDGLIQISGLTPSTTYTLNYVKDGVPQTGISINTGAGVTYDFSGLTNGVYTGISVTAGGCTSNVVSETLVNPSAATIAAIGFNPKTCNGSDGKILITGLSQGLNYTLTYKKDGVAQGSTPISATSTSYMLTGLTAGDYTEIVVSQNICKSNEAMVELTEACDICDPNETPADLNNSAWAAADCDGDGVTNGKEVDPDGNGMIDGNGTNPQNGCDYNSSDQDYTTTTQAWKDLDCDGDGVTNGKEIDPDDDGNAGGTNSLGEGPTSPEDSCDYNSSDKTLPRTSDEPCCVIIETGVWLEGALFNDNDGSYLSSMKTDLWNQGVLPGQNNVKTLGADTPVGQPYNDSPWAYNGSEGTPFNYSTVGDNKAGYSANTVDWVLVSLRTANDIDSTVCTRAALLMKDGSIVFVGNDCCDVDVTKSYYLVIEHRNHLIVMSPTPIAVSADNKISFDFRTNQSFKPGFNDDGQKQLNDGRFVMYAGNGDQTAGAGSFADINSQDNAKWSQQNNSSDGYFYGDHTLSGDVNAQDNSIWDDNNNVTSGVDR